MSKSEVNVCCICGCEFEGWGNNPWPVSNNYNDVCCDDCNSREVIPARIAGMFRRNTHA